MHHDKSFALKSGSPPNYSLGTLVSIEEDTEA